MNINQCIIQGRRLLQCVEIDLKFDVKQRPLKGNIEYINNANVKQTLKEIIKE